MPIMARHPSQNTEEMGARLSDLSVLVVPTSTTGVPKYKMEGSLILCIFFYQNWHFARNGKTRLLRYLESLKLFSCITACYPSSAATPFS
jgi:hypothetical protein